MAPPSQGLEPPANPERFTKISKPLLVKAELDHNIQETTNMIEETE